MSVPTPPPPTSVQRDFPLARLSTVRTGGSAELFARVGDAPQLLELLAWAHAARAPVAVVGSGSNLLIADTLTDLTVVRLANDAIAVDGSAQHWLAERGYDPIYGARPLRRVIQKELMDNIARKLLAGDIADGSVIEVKASADGLEIGKALVH